MMSRKSDVSQELTRQPPQGLRSYTTYGILAMPISYSNAELHGEIEAAETDNTWLWVEAPSVYRGDGEIGGHRFP